METAAEGARAGASTSTSTIPHVDVVLEDLSYSVATGKEERFTILHNIQASFVAGQLTALMGPSGSGKSTLLDIVAGRKSVTNSSPDSRVWFNGRVPDIEDYRQNVGYVEQFDTLVGELTVESMLQYTAALKLPRNTTPSARAARVIEVLQMLNLESCRSNRIGKPLRRGISGGQAVRDPCIVRHNLLLFVPLESLTFVVNPLHVHTETCQYWIGPDYPSTCVVIGRAHIRIRFTCRQ